MLHRAVAGWPGLGWPLRPLLNVELKPWLLSRSFPHVSSSLGHSTNFLTSPTFVLSKLWATRLGFYFYRTQDKCFVLFVGLFYILFNVIWARGRIKVCIKLSNMSMVNGLLYWHERFKSYFYDIIRAEMPGEGVRVLGPRWRMCHITVHSRWIMWEPEL